MINKLTNNPVANMKLYNVLSSLFMADSANIEFYKSKGMKIQTVIPAFIKTGDINFFTRGTGNESTDIRYYIKNQFESIKQRKDLCEILQQVIEEETRENAKKYFEQNKNENDTPINIGIMELLKEGNFEKAYELDYDIVAKQVLLILEEMRNKCLESINIENNKKNNMQNYLKKEDIENNNINKKK